MSGGHFEYKNHYMNDIASDIESIIKHNGVVNDEDIYSLNLKPETIDEFKKAVSIIKLASVYAHRIDYLVSGDDGEESFHKRLEKDKWSLDIGDQGYIDPYGPLMTEVKKIVKDSILAEKYYFLAAGGWLCYSADEDFLYEKNDMGFSFALKFAFIVPLSDTFAWASVDGEQMEPEDIEEVYHLVSQYGIRGIWYWGFNKKSKRDGFKIENIAFKSVIRGIKFVEEEEKIRSSTSSSSEYAYKSASYNITDETKYN